MFYLGSLLGLYFPYDFCLYPNATAVEVYAIKCIPFVVALVVCTVFGALTRLVLVNAMTLFPSHLALYFSEFWMWHVWSGLVCRYLAREHLNFSGVWLIATLLMNPSILISSAILHCPNAQRENGSWTSVRYTCTFMHFGFSMQEQLTKTFWVKPPYHGAFINCCALLIK